MKSKIDREVRYWREVFVSRMQVRVHEAHDLTVYIEIIRTYRWTLNECVWSQLPS